jgi:site-specific recombinase XerD
MAHVRGLAASTRENAVRIVGRMLRKHFDEGAINLGVITPEDVRKFFAEQAKLYTTPASLGTVVSGLRGYFRWRSTLGDCTHALTGVLASPANWQQASLPKSLAPAEVTQLVAALGAPGRSMRRTAAMVRCALDLGLRIGEVASLSLDDIDWNAGTITLRRTKSRRDDVMPLPAVTGDAIAAYLRYERPKTAHRFVFASHKAPRERPIGAALVGKSISEAYVRAGLACTRPHLLRHTMAARLLAGGSSIKEVADVLRHRSLSSTQVYAKLDIDHLLEVALPWPTASAPSASRRQS